MACPRITATQFEHDAPLDGVIAAIARTASPVVLESIDTAPGRGRFSIFACDPLEVISPARDQDPLAMLQRHMQAFPRPIFDRPAVDLPFVGGWIGYLAYEAGHHVEPTVVRTHRERERVEMPLARFAMYDTALIHDAMMQRWSIVAVDWGDERTPAGVRAPANTRIDAMRRLLDTAAPRPQQPPVPEVAWRDNMPRSQYLRMIDRARAYIAAGDIFQVNLARRRSFARVEQPLETYLRLRLANPAAYAAFLSWREASERDQAILSASPELFLSLRGREVTTCPIKGTRPRSSDASEDSRLRSELLLSAKDRAELAMIVDLERNDLGRVCEFGSVQVVPAASGGPYALETHPTVHHLVATVRGTLRGDATTIDLLRACFPGGSITGAPKVRAMQIIDELEPTERGVYTGAIGYVGLDGNALFNIAIRTLVVSGDEVHMYAGGGIVADSIAEDEYAETEAKALGMARALGAAPPASE